MDAFAWGGRANGFLAFVLQRDQQHGTDLAHRIYLIPAVEGHIIDGIAPHSLDWGIPPPNGPVSPYWYRPVHPQRSKNIEKHRLIDVVDRAQLLHNWYHVNQLLGMQNLPPMPMPAYNPPGMVGNVDKLDRFLNAMAAEKAWRSGWMTPAQAAIVQARNNGRNNAYQ